MAAADGPTLDRVLAALERQGAETAARFDQLQEVLVTMPQLRTSFTTLQSQVQGMAQVVAGNSDSLAETGTVIQSIQGQVLDVKQQAQALGTKQDDGLLFYCDRHRFRLCIPTAMRSDLLSILHDDTIGGHPR